MRSPKAMFCPTLRWGKSAKSWNISPKLRVWTGTCAKSCPWQTTRPASACSSPAMMRSSVVLPQPLGPRKQTISPAAIVRSMPSSTT